MVKVVYSPLQKHLRESIRPSKFFCTHLLDIVQKMLLSHNPSSSNVGVHLGIELEVDGPGASLENANAYEYTVLLTFLHTRIDQVKLSGMLPVSTI